MKKNNEIVISAKNIHKDFYLPHENTNSLKSSIVNVFKPKDKGIDTQHALKGITFEVKKGEFFGIVGRNGSGKSTLLKILAQIYQPSKGSVKTKGKLVPFIELGVGFNPELTGRENVYLNGALLGFSKDEIKEKYDDIVEFAELEEFMDQKLKNYSSGMQVRLAFSVAIQADGDILLLDEVLAVGDEAFQRKCNNYFKKLKDEKKTVILVTHSMENVRKYCSKAMMIQGGKIKLIGSPEDVANEYRLNNLDLSRTGKDRNFESDVIKSFKAELISSTTVSQNDKVKVKYSFVSNKKMKLNVSIDVSNYDEKYYIYCSQSKLKEVFPGVKNEITMVVDVSCINNMNVIVNSSLRDENFNPIVFIGEGDSPIFTIQRDDYTMGTPQPGVIFVDEVNVQWKDAH